MLKLVEQYRSLRSHAAASRLAKHVDRHPMALCVLGADDMAMVNEALALCKTKAANDAELALIKEL